MEQYRILEKLNSGSMGTVFKLLRLRDSAVLVLKRIPLLDLTDEQRDQAKLEVELMKQLHHPHIVAYCDAFLFNDEDLCIVMEHLNGGDLSQAIVAVKEKRLSYSEAEVLNYFVQILLALHYLHSHRILHRDLKTQNVFINADTNELALGDFGVAKILESTHSSTSTTSGTPLYMAPEVLQGNVYTFKSDVWSAGCIFYELLCGRHPFEAHDISGLVIKVIRGGFPPIPGKYSKPIVQLVDSMLERDPRKRPLVDELLMAPLLQSALHRYLSTRRPVYPADHPAERMLDNQMDMLNVRKKVVETPTFLEFSNGNIHHGVRPQSDQTPPWLSEVPPPPTLMPSPVKRPPLAGRRSNAREHELYELCRERDKVFLDTRVAKQTNVYGVPRRSVRDVVASVLSESPMRLSRTDVHRSHATDMRSGSDIPSGYHHKLPAGFVSEQHELKFNVIEAEMRLRQRRQQLQVYCINMIGLEPFRRVYDYCKRYTVADRQPSALKYLMQSDSLHVVPRVDELISIDNEIERIQSQ